MGDLDVRAIALVVFLTLGAALFVGLVTDLILHVTGQATISAAVWAEPVMGITVMLPVVGMVVALAVHLFYR